ncbi:response regulator [Stenotrophomonas sp. CD2]|nr:response regulator [Stenotrophomonas sp. CD2]
MFAPFTQAGAYIQRDHGGTGLGLSICQRLVQMMDGELALHSTLGEGTRAEVRLSLVEAGSGDVEALVAEQDQAALLPAPLREARVLVIEDHPTNQAMMAWRLQQLGVPHVMVGDGQQGLDRLALEHFDLVITDCRMPVLDGFGFTRLLREREGRNGQPRLTVLALTASVLDDDARRCREAGMDEVLAKPLSLATLRAALLRWLPQAQGQSFEAPVVEAAGDDGDALPDLATLQQRFGSRAVAEQLSESLLRASEGDLAAVQRALQAGDRTSAALHLHRQAGGLGAVGATGLAGQANALVERLQDAAETDVAPLFTAVAEFVARLQQQLQRLAH